MRTQETIQESLKAGKFISIPGDIYTVKGSSNMLSNSLTLHLVNSQESIYFGLPNELDAWKFLKSLNETGGRKVYYQIDNNEPINFEDSLPYKYRFSN